MVTMQDGLMQRGQAASAPVPGCQPVCFTDMPVCAHIMSAGWKWSCCRSAAGLLRMGCPVLYKV